jgi:hypothetical protein
MALSTNVPKFMLLMAFGALGLVNLASPTRAYAQLQSLPDDPSFSRPVEKVPKRDFLHWVAEAYFVGGTMADMKTTGDGLQHPTNAYTTSGKFLMQYTVRETGWASFLGSRNTFGVTSANVLLNTGVDALGRRLYGRHRRIALLVLAAKATGNWWDASHNMKVLGNIDKNVRLQTGYPGALVWAN